jgi:hypothetical protein
MDIRKPPSEREAIAWLKAGRVELPPLRLRITQIGAKSEQMASTWDFELEVAWSEKRSKFVAEYKSLSTPKAFEDAIRQCQSVRPPPGRRPLVVLPYLRSSQLEQLDRLGLSGLDLCGNGVVVVPGSFRVFRTGAPNRFSSSAPIKNIYRKNTSMVARIFAAQPAFPNLKAVREAVNARNPFVRSRLRTPMRLGTVSKAIKGLADDLVIERSDGIRLLQADKLLSLLADNYRSPEPVRTRRLKVPAASAESWVRERLRDSGTPVVATGLSSVGKYAAMAREDCISLYCPGLDEVWERLGGIETDRFPNVELIETDEESVYFDSRSDQGFAWASPLQTYLELMTGDNRDQETAEQVKALLARSTK